MPLRRAVARLFVQRDFSTRQNHTMRTVSSLTLLPRAIPVTRSPGHFLRHIWPFSYHFPRPLGPATRSRHFLAAEIESPEPRRTAV
jgi:hypothetical protein